MTKLPPKIHATTQKFTEIKDVIGNIVTFTSGNACLIIEVTATNFSLLSKEEQDAKIISYSHFESGPKTAQAALEKNAKTTLDLKAKSLLSQLQRLNLYAKILEKEELTKLFYEIYNGDLVETNQTEDNVKTLIVKAESNV